MQDPPTRTDTATRTRQTTKKPGVRSGRGGRALSGASRADAVRRTRREGRARRGSRYPGDDALRGDSRMRPPGAVRTANGSETEHGPQARQARRDELDQNCQRGPLGGRQPSARPQARRIAADAPPKAISGLSSGAQATQDAAHQGGSARLPPSGPHADRQHAHNNRPTRYRAAVSWLKAIGAVSG